MNKKLIIGFFGLFVIILIWSAVSLYPEWLWFENLEFSSVFWTMLLSKFGIGLVVWLVFMLIVFINLYLARRMSPRTGPGIDLKSNDDYSSQLPLSGKALNSLCLCKHI